MSEDTKFLENRLYVAMCAIATQVWMALYVADGSNAIAFGVGVFWAGLGLLVLCGYELTRNRKYP